MSDKKGEAAPASFLSIITHHLSLLFNLVRSVDAARGLLLRALAAVADDAVVAQVDDHAAALAGSLLCVLDVRGVAGEYDLLVLGGVLRPVARAAPSGLCDDDVMLRDGVLDLVGVV